MERSCGPRNSSIFFRSHETYSLSFCTICIDTAYGSVILFILSVLAVVPIFDILNNYQCRQLVVIYYVNLCEQIAKILQHLNSL